LCRALAGTRGRRRYPPTPVAAPGPNASFEPSKKGRIAVKVTNHYGDERLKVFDVGKVQNER